MANQADVLKSVFAFSPPKRILPNFENAKYRLATIKAFTLNTNSQLPQLVMFTRAALNQFSAVSPSTIVPTIRTSIRTTDGQKTGPCKAVKKVIFFFKGVLGLGLDVLLSLISFFLWVNGINL